MSLPPATYIDSQAELTKLVHELNQETLIGVDTESNNLHAYQEQVCLIQISTRINDYIVDPLVIEDVSIIGTLFFNPNLEKVLHTAESDIASLRRDFQFEFNNVFDTMWAARVCGYPLLGLRSLLDYHFSVVMNKRHQRDNWALRPLSEASLQYAQMDTYYLPILRDVMLNQLKEYGHLEEAQEIFRELCATPPAPLRQFDEDEFWRLGIPHGLEGEQLTALRALTRWRDDTARQEDVPIFQVLSNRAIIQIARHLPETRDELYQLDKVSEMTVQLYGEPILQTIQQGRIQPLPSFPHLETPNPIDAGRFTVLNLWRKEQAEKRGVESDVIVSKQTLWELAMIAPKTYEGLNGIAGLGAWRKNRYGESLLKVIHEYESNMA